MVKASFLQSRKGFEAVSVYGRTRHHILFQESEKRCVFEIRDQSHPSTPCYPATFLHGHQDERGFPPLQLLASPQSGLSTANPSLVDFHFVAQRIAFQVDHSAAELVKQHPCCLIASQTKLALQKKRRDPAFIGGHQVGSPKPDRQRHLWVMKNGLCGHRNLLPTTGTLPAAQFHQFISTPVPASRTHKTIRPAAGSQVLSTSLFGGELRLKFAQGFGKRRASHQITLPLSGLLKQPDKHELANPKMQRLAGQKSRL